MPPSGREQRRRRRARHRRRYREEPRRRRRRARRWSCLSVSRAGGGLPRAARPARSPPRRSGAAGRPTGSPGRRR
ncbi:hypothetical protein GCE86_15630 [Micromonospora terminaliae]|uniref:Uncharacterized protein n=1 Tax=Micromonospora terminaliae TaxID=1914461 RepID=A0ABX6E411_9ACTN|nr:hypothetical protein GCE86_15630 [Micromonospora terminaliae]